MNKRTVIVEIEIDREKAKSAKRWLRRRSAVPDFYREEVITCESACLDYQSSPNGPQMVEVDIKICNSEDGPYVDPVLFCNGNQISCLEPGDSYEGRFEFRTNSFNQTVYVVVIKRASPVKATVGSR